MEQIALDMGTVLSRAFPALRPRADEVRNIGLVARMRAGGRVLYEELGLEVVEQAQHWPSDTTRGWAAMSVGQAPGLTLSTRLRLIRPFASDQHFAVREWAWLSLRPHIAAELPNAVRRLVPWTSDPCERIRRYASEVTRPRGVWSMHIADLKADPGMGIMLLEPLRCDDSRYVQDSVANWLNDAAKTRPDWVRAVCARWAAEEPAPATARICRRAQRAIAPGA
jgi:3-methyladenine DNA glycosylase AlkC